MSTDAESLVRRAFEALASGDVDSMLELVDEGLEWTYLDPSQKDPEPQICHGRDQLGHRLARGSASQVTPEVEELVAFGDRVLVVTHWPGLDAQRARKTGDRNFHVVTVGDGRITALRAFRSREVAISSASGSPADHPPPPQVEPLDTAISALAVAIRTGDLAAVERLLHENNDLVTARLGGATGRTALHVATDWPGFFPNAPEIVRILLASGADPDARTGGGEGAETPLHWAASSGDVEVAAALIVGGADLDAPDGSIGTPVENAVGYGCFDVARCLVANGERVDTTWVAAALGLRERLEELVAAGAPDQKKLDEAFWHACSGGQLRIAQYLHRLGADVNAMPGYSDVLPLDHVGGLDTQREALVGWLKRVGGRSASSDEAAS